MTRLDPLMRISDQFAEALRTHEPEHLRRGDAAALPRGPRRRRHPADPLSQLPLRVLGGDAPADHDRARPGLPPEIRRSPTSRRPPSTCSSRRRSCSIIAELKQNFDASLLLITHNLGIVAECVRPGRGDVRGPHRRTGAVDDIFSRSGAPVHPRAHALDDLVVDRGSTSYPARRPTSSNRRRGVGSTRAAPWRCGSAPATSRSVRRCTRATSRSAGFTVLSTT